ncbi:MAG: ATP-binding cassette domain-containing protein [Pseudomonadota bacterium]
MLEAADVTVSLGGRRALDGATLRLAPGRVTALVGPNGAGKSTLLACLSGALGPDAGRISLDGDDPVRLTPAELGCRRAVLDQSPAAAAPFTLAELVELGIPRAIPPAEARRMVREATAALGLETMAGRSIHALSGGERHRGHMARVLAQLWAGRQLGGGRWLLLDEPTASLDLAHQASVMRAARRAAAEGVGVLAVLHDLSLAGAMADTVALMQQGRIVATGPPRYVLTNDRLAPVYGIEVAIAEPCEGVRAVVPVYRSTPGEDPCSSP